MSRSPTLTLVGVFVVVYLLELAAGVVGVTRAAFALAAPLGYQPWTLVTSVYAHASVAHLVGNSIVLLLIGLYLERQTSRLRFHAFFLVTGVVAGIAQVWVGGLLGPPTAVLGASGAIAALLGYLLTGNRMSETVLDTVPLGPQAQLAAFVVVAAVLTLATGGPRVALVAHFTGFMLGLVAGQAHLLRTGGDRKERR